jgi:O-antigen/teichoic acid export membrane protein
MKRLRRSLAADTLVVTSGRFGQYVVTIVAIPVLARRLGVHELGVLALGTSAYFFGSAFCDLGLTQALASASAGRTPIISRRFFLTLRLVLFGLALVALVLGMRFGSRGVAIVTLGFAVGAASSLSEDWLLIAAGQFARLAVAQFAGRITYLGLLFLLLARQPRAETALVSLGLGGLVTVALTHLFVSAGRRKAAGSPVAESSEGIGGWKKDVLVVRRLAVDITGQKVMNLTYNQGIALFLGPLVPTVALGLYSASDKCVRACQALLDGFGLALVGRLARHREDDERFAPLATRALRGAFLLGLAAAVGLFLGSDLAVSVLFGPEFAGAADVLKFEAWILVPVALSTVATDAILYVRGDTRGPLWATAAGIVGAACSIPVVIATRSPFALAFSATVSEVSVALCLILWHTRAQARRRRFVAVTEASPAPPRGTAMDPHP